jgi:hypothetical protein
MIMEKILKFELSVILMFLLMVFTGSSLAQEKDEPALKFENKIVITIYIPLNFARFDSPVIIPVSEIRKKDPDFNAAACRVKYWSEKTEPLDIPFQICKEKNGAAIVFTIDINAKEKKYITLQDNTGGEIVTNCPARTQAFEKWYTDGSNIAWENEIIAYRSYLGVVDFFGKTYPHLRLQNLAPDSYHHERFWGIDPYVIGEKPGLAGITLIKGNETLKLYGNTENNTYTHKLANSGPVLSEPTVSVSKAGKTLTETKYRLFANRYENIAETSVSDLSYTPAIGMQKYDNEKYFIDEKIGYMFMQTCPLEEYGTIGTALFWAPESADGIFETGEGHFVRLKPSGDGSIHYSFMAVWYRGSDEKPHSVENLRNTVKKIALEHRNPLKIKIESLYRREFF